MIEREFPSLYLDANKTALDTQRYFIASTKCVIVGSIITGFAGIAKDSSFTTIIQIISSFCVLSASSYLLFGRPQKVWYSTRALAESVKTLSWRYVCRAEPFNGDEAGAARSLAAAVAQLLRANDEASSLRYDSVHFELVTDEMRTYRGLSLDKRIALYIQYRVDDQLKWYTSKAKWNNIRSKVWYGALITFSFVALVFSLLKLDSKIDAPVDWLFSLPIAIFGWIQVKKYQELASSYALTAHEITFAKSDFSIVPAEAEFAVLVANMENAFSREHTQWYARKDLA